MCICFSGLVSSTEREVYSLKLRINWNVGKYFFYTVIRPFLSWTGSSWSCTGLQRNFFLMPLKLLSFVKHPQDRILLTEQIKWTGFYMRGILVVINPRKWFVKDSHYNVKSVQIRNLFWSIFSYIQSEYREMRTRKNSVFGNLSHSVYFVW